MVLFLFVVMLLNLNADIEPHKDNVLKVSAGGCRWLPYAYNDKCNENCRYYANN